MPDKNNLFCLFYGNILDVLKKIIKSYTIDNCKFKDDFSNITFEMVLNLMAYKIYCKHEKYSDQIKFIKSEDLQKINNEWDNYMKNKCKPEIY